METLPIARVSRFSQLPGSDDPGTTARCRYDYKKKFIHSLKLKKMKAKLFYNHLCLFVLQLFFIAVLCAQQITLPLSGVSFPKGVMPVNAGRIEFYAKLNGFSGYIPIGGVAPHFFMINDGAFSYHMGFNSNDGAGNGGLVGSVGNSFRTGTGIFGVYTYEQIYGAANVAEWHHYIFQWNKDGIPGINNGQEKLAIYIDGVLNSARWSVVTGSPGTFGSFSSCPTLNLSTTGNAGDVNGQVVMDEFKIFDGNDNLVLWNTLGSANEVMQSNTGLNGSLNENVNVQFVPGISGNAIIATPVFSIGNNEGCNVPSLSCSIKVSPAQTLPNHQPNTIYLGIGEQTLSLTGEATGGNGEYSYDWGAAGMGASISVSPNTTTTYTLTVKDEEGNTGTCTVTIYVVDVRCGKHSNKVTVCHHNKTLCLDYHAAIWHFAHGDHLGSCNDALPELFVKVYPNPTHNYFTVEIKSNNKTDKVTLRVMDLYSRVVEVRNNVSPDQIIQMGSNYRRGVYILKVTQAGVMKSLLLIKLGNGLSNAN